VSLSTSARAAHDLRGMMLEAVNLHLEAKGIRIATGTI
jgi:IS5 family transposase